LIDKFFKEGSLPNVEVKKLTEETPSLLERRGGKKISSCYLKKDRLAIRKGEMGKRHLPTDGRGLGRKGRKKFLQRSWKKRKIPTTTGSN